MLYYAILYYTILYHAMLYYAILCYAILCYTMLCYAKLYYAILRYTVFFFVPAYAIEVGSKNAYQVQTDITLDIPGLMTPVKSRLIPFGIPGLMTARRYTLTHQWK